jgi:predicted PurR-regulated permease PerM
MAARRGSAEPESTPASARFGIVWSDQSVRLLALAIGVLIVLWLARGIIGPFVVAGMLAYAFSPVVSSVESRTRLPRVVIVGFGFVLFLGFVAVVAFVAAERAGKELTDLSSGGHDVISSALHKLLGNTVVIAGNTYNVEDLAGQIRRSFLGLVNSPTSAVQMAERAVAIALQAILCLIVTFYLLLDGRRFGQFALRFLAREQRVGTLRIAHRIHVVLGRWLRGQLVLIALVTAVIYVILGPILHVPYALALAISSGVLEIVPLVGPIIAAALAATAAYSAHGTDTTVVVLVVYLVVRQVEDQVVMPLVIGRAVHLHPVITIFAVLVGLSTWGVLGGLLGVPVAAAINVTLHELYPEETGGHAEWDAEVKKAEEAGGGGESGVVGESATKASGHAPGAVSGAVEAPARAEQP